MVPDNMALGDGGVPPPQLLLEIPSGSYEVGDQTHNASHSGKLVAQPTAAAAAAGRFMICSKRHLFNSRCRLHHLWAQHWPDCWPSVAGRRASAHHHTRTLLRRQAELGEASEGAKYPLPAVCKKLVCQLSHQGVHVLRGALCLQSQVDLLQVSFLWNRQA